MKLRSLQIKGFKSFGNETTIHFNDEIIGIVGPNGSGKSNIVDAIRWVLGEQKSKELRLEKMVDVIFNGTKTKRKAGMAMVSMIFENSRKLIPVEFDQVKISRILYDTNDSEYRINDVPCRLKDVRDLFIDTGIGSNSYAIIELGMVDDILVDKDHSRRKMFEQAAGISKYKTRKRETQLKLKNTQNDLDRVEDILFELRSNMKSLERQARRTKKYYELKDEYKNLSVKKAILNQGEAIDKEKKYKEELSRENEALVKITSEISALEAEVEKIKKDNLDNEQSLSHKQKEFNSIVDNVRTGESQKEIKKQNISFLDQNIKRENNNLQEYISNLSGIDTLVQDKDTELKVLLENGLELEKKYIDTKSRFEEVELERQNIQGATNEEISALKELEDQKFQLEKSIIELSSQSTNYSHNRNQALEEKEKQERIHEELQKKSSEINSELEEVRNRLENLRNKKESLESDKQVLLDKIDDEKENLRVLNRKLDAHTNEHRLLKDMVDNLEGFPESAKFLVKEWKGSRPLLSDIIECPDEYRPAIESYLDAYLSYFILDSVEEARTSINLLKQAQKGRSQFFILSSFHDKVSNTQVLYDFHGLPALEVVKCEEKYNSLVHFLLQNVVLVEDEEVLKSDMLDEDVTYLSRNGTTNRTKHVISGGSVGLFDGKRIGRKSEIEKLLKSIERTQSEITKSEKNIADKNSRINALFDADYDQLINETITKRNTLEVKSAEMAIQLSSAQQQISSLLDRISFYENEDKLGMNQVKLLESSLTKLAEQIGTKKNQLDSQAGSIENITRRYAEINALYNETQLIWVKHQNDIKNLQNEISFRHQQHQELLSKKEGTLLEIETLRENKKKNEAELIEIENRLLESYKIKKIKQEELNHSEQAFFSNRSVVNEKEELLRERNRKFQSLQLSINEIKDKLTGVEFELRSAIERLKIEFNIDLKSLSREEYVVEDDEVDALMERYEKIRKRLDNYGEINPLAVEAYDEILGRLETMQSQRDDILEARTSLEETIKEIDNDATQKFLDSFYKVKENFKMVFRSLFSSEDDCDLVLFNAEHPLESDIEIIAKPKGKRPKVLNQLSGGEKTLTATALLFSLYLLKPAPFCIFDEVDAPLDDVNIQKFSKLIRDFADESQFIIITHNKSTMAAMDLLYGVYMQEQGISGVTQVDFREYEHDEIFQNVSL
ncbi:MAG: chromosome segregation protein SMC [Saprospiraceae bacterium]|nr:chromosome segregation protein SMC [Saprospiraceae bacterium]